MTIQHSEKQGVWKAVKPLQIARSHPGVASFRGKIYVIGGGGPGFESLRDVEIFDPKVNQWEKGKEMPTARSGMATFQLGGKIYVVGGGYKQPNGKFKFLRTVEIYDPHSDQWEKGIDMLQPHDYPAFSFLEGCMYILGGHHPDATEGGPQTDPGFGFCEVFDFKRDSWSELPALPKPRFAATAVSMNGKIFAFGGVAFTGKGMTEYDHMEIYDPSRGVWEKASLQMPWSSAAHGTCLHGGKLYVFGGFSGDKGIGNQTARYDIVKNHWESIAPLPEARAAMGVSIVEDSIYLLGGWSSDRSVMNSVVQYLP